MGNERQGTALTCSFVTKAESIIDSPKTPRAELGGSWKSEVNKEIKLDKGQYKSRIIFIRRKLLRVKICIYQIHKTKNAFAVVIKASMPMIRSKNKLKQKILLFSK